MIAEYAADLIRFGEPPWPYLSNVIFDQPVELAPVADGSTDIIYDLNAHRHDQWKWIN